MASRRAGQARQWAEPAGILSAFVWLHSQEQVDLQDTKGCHVERAPNTAAEDPGHHLGPHDDLGCGI